MSHYPHYDSFCKVPFQVVRSWDRCWVCLSQIHWPSQDLVPGELGYAWHPHLFFFLQLSCLTLTEHVPRARQCFKSWVLRARLSDIGADTERNSHLPSESLQGTVVLWSQCWKCYVGCPTVGPWASYLPTLFYSVLICKMKLKIICTLWGCWEDYMSSHT